MRRKLTTTSPPPPPAPAAPLPARRFQPQPLLLSRRAAARWIWCALLLLAIGLTRWPWILADGGTPAMNEYGYFVTDEGFYVGGAKEKMVSGRFVDVVRGETCTYSICPALHWLTYGAYRLFGRTEWAHRFFPFLINALAWAFLFLTLARRTLPWIAFSLCAAILAAPLVTVYERTACNDVLMASVIMAGFCLARRPSLAGAILGGAIFGLGALVKKSIIVLAIFGISAILMQTGRKRRAVHLAAFCGTFLLTAVLCRFLVRWSIAADAAEQGISATELLRISHSAYALPSLLDWRGIFKGLSSFPRMPTDSRLGVLTALFFLLPALVFLRRFARAPLRWHGRTLFLLTFPLYACGIMILDAYYASYLLPLIVMIPWAWVEARRELRAPRAAHEIPRVAAVAWGAGIVIALVRARPLSQEQAAALAPFISQAFNPPEAILWLYNGWPILMLAGALLIGLLLARPRQVRAWPTLCLLAACLVTANLCFSLLPLTSVAAFAPHFEPVRASALTLQVASVALLIGIWHAPRCLTASTRWLGFFAALLIWGWCAHPNWRASVSELSRRNFLQRQAVAELRRLLPENAVVTGERGPQLLLTLSARATPSSYDTLPMLRTLHQKDPETAFFCLVDLQQAYVWQYYRNNPDLIRMELVHTLTLPSFASNEPIDVHLVRLTLLNPPAAPPP